MENISNGYLERAEVWLFMTTVIYFCMNGAQIFETAVLVPRWTANVPDTLQLLRNRNGINLKTFWICFHSIHEITFIIAIIFCWKIDSIRNILILLFVLHFAIRVWTLTYFAPNIIDFQNIAETSKQTSDLMRRVEHWKILNYVRVAVFIAISIALLPLCLKLFRIKTG